MAKRKKRRKPSARKRRTPSRGVERQAGDLGLPWPEPKCDLKTAVALVEQHAGQPFHLKEIVAEIRRHARIRNPDPREHIRSLLSEAPGLARIPAEELYLPAKHLFQEAVFYIAPTEQELAEGILVPGHRFYPFMNASVPPNQVAISPENGAAFPRQTMVWPFEELLIFHSLMGVQEMLLLCKPVDEGPLQGPETLVEFEAYDLSAFYQAHGFSQGDLILARVLDYAAGVFQLSYADAQMRLLLQKDTVEQDAQLEGYLVELMEVAGPDPPLYLLRDAYAHLSRVRGDLSKPASPFGQFLGQSKRVALSDYHTRPCLVPWGEEPMEYYGSLSVPEYDGRCETLEDLFVKGDLSLDMPYVCAVILDDLDHARGGKEAVVERIMKGRLIPQWDKSDWAFFHEEFGQLWEEIQRQRRELSPNQQVRAFRRRILEQCDEHLAFLRELDWMGLEPEELPSQEMVAMATLDGFYHQLLAALETPLDKEEIELLEEQFSAMEEQGAALRTAIETALGEEDGEGEEEEWEDEDWEIEGPTTTYVLKVKFKYAKRIWRKIEIAAPQTLDHLHLAIQEAIDWDEDHLYSFFMSNRRGDQTSEFASPYTEDARRADRVRLGDLGLEPGQKFLYLFDYGDEHEFEVEVVEIRTDAPAGRYPKLIESRGEAPEQYGEW